MSNNVNVNVAGAVEHSPAPWAVRNETHVMAADGQVAMCGFRMGDWPPEEYAREAANARLVAAAPELLEALERLTSSLFGDSPTAGACNTDSPNEAAARAAIRKARGD